jgi:hypothetical protein
MSSTDTSSTRWKRKEKRERTLIERKTVASDRPITLSGE